MRIAIWSAGSNPAIDLPIIKKSPSYVENLVSDGKAYWHKQLGVIMRAHHEIPRESVANGGTFDEAWAIIPSGHEQIGVWQLKTR